VRFSPLHDWDVSPAEAGRIQTELAGRVLLRDAVALGEIGVVAGVDNTYLTVEGQPMACAVVMALTFRRWRSSKRRWRGSR
jgi:deoxyinosine 3'endonuclease (endonuclease V)